MDTRAGHGLETRACEMLFPFYGCLCTFFGLSVSASSSLQGSSQSVLGWCHALLQFCSALLKYNTTFVLLVSALVFLINFYHYIFMLINCDEPLHVENMATLDSWLVRPRVRPASITTVTSSSSDTETDSTQQPLSLECSSSSIPVTADYSDDGDMDGSGKSVSDESPVELSSKRYRRSSPHTKTGHHRKSGFNPAWSKEYKWLECVRKDSIVGMRCKLCAKHGKVPRNGKGASSTTLCYTLIKDKVRKHSSSRMHKAALTAEFDQSNGGITRAFEDARSLEMKVAIGCCKCIYWLCKHEIPHSTTYPHLISLAQSLGCEYFKALNVSRNATYTSHQILTEFIEIMSDFVEESVLCDMKSGFYSLMVDESTDVSVLKQLVLYGRVVIEGKV